MYSQEIIDAVLEAYMEGLADSVGDVEAPCGHWAYWEVEGTWYGVGTDSYGNKTLEEFESPSEALSHYDAIDDAYVSWYMGPDEDHEDDDEPEFVYDDVEA